MGIGSAAAPSRRHRWIFVLLWTAVLAASPPAGAIVGGTPSTRAGVVLVVNTDNPYVCTGFVVDTQWVMTTATCVADLADSFLFVVFDHDFTDMNADVFRAVVDVRINPAWSPDVFGRDIALLRMDHAGPVAPLNVDLSPRGPADIGLRGPVVGYGTTSGSGSDDLLKREAVFRIDSFEEDGRLLFDMGTTPNLCSGDFGAPWILNGNNAVIAIATVRLGECNAASGFSRLDLDAAFIRSVITVCPPGESCPFMKDGFE